MNLINSPSKYFSKSLIKTPIDSFKSNKPTLALIGKHDDDFLIATLTILLNDISNFLNVGKNFTVPQIEQTCYLIAENFKHLKIDDIVICFNRAKSGFYGKSYDRLDGMMVMEWLNAYEMERDEQIVNLRQNENNRIKKNIDESEINPKAVPMPDNVKEFIKKIGKKQEAEKLRSMSEEEYQTQRLLARLDKQFSNLFRKYGVTIKGYRFLVINDLKVNLKEFLDYKLENYYRLSQTSQHLKNEGPNR